MHDRTLLQGNRSERVYHEMEMVDAVDPRLKSQARERAPLPHTVQRLPLNIVTYTV